jgi:myo-inositol 2-dehydrogenase / D-chiro-inositol 1-dehydrogenase
MTRIAVLGCGRIGQVHARNVAQHPKARLVSVFDSVPAAAQPLAERLQVPVARSAEEILASAEVDAVIIATPTDTHVPFIRAAVAAAKPVLCEKPVDLDLARAQACQKDIAASRPRVMLGFNRRFDPSFGALRARVRNGEIGGLELAVITSRDPSPPPAGYIKGSGGLFKDMTIHDFDMARFLVGDITQVHAFGANLVDPAIGRLGDIDTCTIALRAKSGALVQISNSRRCVYGYDQRIEVFGSGGMLQAGNQRATTLEAWSASQTAAREPLLDFFIERYRAAYEAELDAFVRALQEGSAMTPDFTDGVAALQLAAAADDSLRTGRVVDIAAQGAVGPY